MVPQDPSHNHMKSFRQQSFNRQGGLSFWGFIWASVLFILLAVVLVKSIPPYLNNNRIHSGLVALTEEPGIQTMHRQKILRLLKRKLNIDYADEIVNLNKAFKVKKVKGQRQISVNYEVIVPLAYNAFLLFDFKNEVVIPTQ